MEDEEDLYDCVYGEDDGGEVYEDLMKAEEAQQPVGLSLVFKGTLNGFFFFVLFIFFLRKAIG